jgi:hypothetical protein
VHRERRSVSTGTTVAADGGRRRSSPSYLSTTRRARVGRGLKEGVRARWRGVSRRGCRDANTRRPARGGKIPARDASPSPTNLAGDPRWCPAGHDLMPEAPCGDAQGGVRPRPRTSSGYVSACLPLSGIVRATQMRRCLTPRGPWQTAQPRVRCGALAGRVALRLLEDDAFRGYLELADVGIVSACAGLEHRHGAP